MLRTDMLSIRERALLLQMHRQNGLVTVQTSETMRIRIMKNLVRLGCVTQAPKRRGVPGMQCGLTGAGWQVAKAISTIK